MGRTIDHPVGFRVGFASVFRAFGFLLRAHRLWPIACVPGLLLLVLAAAAVGGALFGLRPAIVAWLSPEGTGAAAVGATIAGWLLSALAALAGLLVAVALTPPLSAPALERIVTERERTLAAPERRPLGFFVEMWFGLKAQLFAAAFAVPLLTALWVVDLLAPPAAVVTVPLKIIVVAFALAWNLLDYPLTLRGVGLRDRLSLLRAYKGATFGFGVAFAALFWLPCFQVLMLPVGVAAATELVWRLLERDPSLLPALERPASAQIDGDANLTP